MFFQNELQNGLKTKTFNTAHKFLSTVKILPEEVSKCYGSIPYVS
jgi:hypothetical protein